MVFQIFEEPARL